MSDFFPVRTMADLKTLDEREIFEGYLAGWENSPEPGNNRSRSYWHGWRNGMMDRGHMEPDDASISLAHEYVQHMKKERDSRERHPPGGPVPITRDARGDNCSSRLSS
jgi:hypothetical protein